MDFATRELDLGGPVHVAEWDGDDTGPVFVCVHGLGGSHLNWMLVAPELAKRGRVYALDLIGFGRTPPAGRASTVEANRALVDRFIGDVVGRPAIVLGNSMGGAISMLEAAARPDRVAGLVLVDPASPRSAGARTDPVVAAAFAAYVVPGVGERFVERRLRALGPEGLVRESLRLCTADPTSVDAELVARMCALAHERAGSMPWATASFLEAARSLMRLLARRSVFSKAVASITCPTLLLHGRRDRLVSHFAAAALAKARPDWEFVVFDDLGHIPMMEDPRATTGAIDAWLARAGATAAARSAAATAEGSAFEAS